MTTRSSGSITARWLPSMSSTLRVRRYWPSAVVGDAQNRPSQAVEMDDGRRLRILRRLDRRRALVRALGAVDPLLIPGRQIIAVGQAAKYSPTSWSVLGSNVTVSLTSNAICRHGSKTTFSYVLLGWSVATTRSTGS